MKELVFEELTLEQKLGLVLIGGGPASMTADSENFEHCLSLIRRRALGAMWITPDSSSDPDFMAHIAAVREAADYPILIFTDAENGMAPYLIGRHSAIGYTDSEELAYAFGRVTALRAREEGYHIVCDPLLDMTTQNVPCGGTVRSLGGNKDRVSRLAAAIARGMRDSGILTGEERVKGYLHAMEKAGLSSFEKVVGGSEFSVEEGYRQTLALLGAGTPPTAIFTLSHALVVGAIDAAREKGLKIPEDITLMSFDNNIHTDYLIPHISQPMEDMALLVTQTIFNRLNGIRTGTTHIKLSPKLFRI